MREGKGSQRRVQGCLLVSAGVAVFGDISEFPPNVFVPPADSGSQAPGLAAVTKSSSTQCIVLNTRSFSLPELSGWAVSGWWDGAVVSKPRAPLLKGQLLPHCPGQLHLSCCHSRIPALRLRGITCMLHSSLLLKSSRQADRRIVCPGPRITSRLVGSRYPRDEIEM